MSQIFDRLTFFRKYVDRFSNGFGVVTNENRAWEDSCRQRWQHDKIVRSTHGTNCTCSCSWKIYVKNGLVTWETQQTDYPRTRPDMPNHEPRGCSRGASYSWYLYSGNRLKYPLVRARLVELCRAARQTMNPVEAWTSIVSNPDKRRHYTSIRGRGGFVRASWDDVTEIIAAANAYTIKTYGPDRVAGFSPIPAMSMVSYAAGTRYLSLLGGTSSGKLPMPGLLPQVHRHAVSGSAGKAGRLLCPRPPVRASDFSDALGEKNNPDWKPVALKEDGGVVVPQGSIGFRWGEQGKWNLEPRNAADGSDVMLALSLAGKAQAHTVGVSFPYFGGRKHVYFPESPHNDRSR